MCDPSPSLISWIGETVAENATGVMRHAYGTLDSQIDGIEFKKSKFENQISARKFRSF